MSKLVYSKGGLPATMEELHKFILVGKEKIKAHKAKIAAINRVHTAQSAKIAALQDAQDLGEMVIYAEMQLGEMLKPLSGSTAGTTKVLPKGITKKDSHYAQELERNQGVVEKTITAARDKGIIPTTREILGEIKKTKIVLPKKVPVLPRGKYSVIVIDPPWPYGTEYNSENRRIASPYPEMGLDEIMTLPVPFADDCIVFLWTTHRFMHDAYHILGTWELKPKVIITWVKNRMGMGVWLRSITEFCIMAVKGNPTINLTNQTTVINGKVREHSRKPDEFYNMVDSLCGGKKLDMFAREGRKGWRAWGNETEKY